MVCRGLGYGSEVLVAAAIRECTVMYQDVFDFSCTVVLARKISTRLYKSGSIRNSSMHEEKVYKLEPLPVLKRYSGDDEFG